MTRLEMVLVLGSKILLFADFLRHFARLFGTLVSAHTLIHFPISEYIGYGL